MDPLYPVPFRYLDGPQQFDKYAPISVELHEATQDWRPESAKINVASIRVGKVIKPWQGRSPWVEPLVTGTMCDLVAGTRENLNAMSLGAIPADVDSDLAFKVHPPWSAAQAASLLAAESQGELFGQRGPALKPPRLKAILHYRCEAAGCNGHDQHIIDWDLTALQRRGDRLSDDDLKKSITLRFMHQMFLADTDPVIFVGNQADVRRRASFTVLGVYYPKRQPPPELALFSRFTTGRSGRDLTIAAETRSRRQVAWSRSKHSNATDPPSSSSATCWSAAAPSEVSRICLNRVLLAGSPTLNASRLSFGLPR